MCKDRGTLLIRHPLFRTIRQLPHREGLSYPPPGETLGTFEVGAMEIVANSQPRVVWFFFGFFMIAMCNVILIEHSMKV